MSSKSGDRLCKIKFPECILQGLQKLEEINKSPASPQQSKQQQQIVEELILVNRHDGTTKYKGGSAVDELIVVRCIADYLSKVVDPGRRNSLFITLFPCVNTDSSNLFDIQIISSLISLAVATHNVAVLDTVAVWMQQVGCFNKRCSQVTSGLIQDFFQSSSVVPSHYAQALNSLPTATPLFTANLMTSLAQIYAKIGATEICDIPPLSLMNIVLYWLKTDPFLALTPLIAPLPGISLAMTAVLAIAPLAKWCIEAPFFVLEENRDSEEAFDSYAELHLLLLQSVQNVAQIQSKMTQREVLCAEHVKSIAESLVLRLSHDGVTSSAKELSLNRLAQIVLVSYHTNCLSGRMSEMWKALKNLPCETRLMKALLQLSTC